MKFWNSCEKNLSSCNNLINYWSNDSYTDSFHLCNSIKTHNQDFEWMNIGIVHLSVPSVIVRLFSVRHRLGIEVEGETKPFSWKFKTELFM